jgi:hypothetical protein
VIVYLLYHVSHKARDDAGQIRHRWPENELSVAEDEGDDVKLLGVYSSQARAEQRRSGARKLPGFRDEPECFQISAYKIDHDEWPESYARA